MAGRAIPFLKAINSPSAKLHPALASPQAPRTSAAGCRIFFRQFLERCDSAGHCESSTRRARPCLVAHL